MEEKGTTDDETVGWHYQPTNVTPVSLVGDTGEA